MFALLLAVLGGTTEVRAQAAPGAALPPLVTGAAEVAGGIAVRETAARYGAGEQARRQISPMLLNGSDRSGILFELHGRYYQVMGRTNILSADPRFDTARRRLYEVMRAEWTGYQGILRTSAYAANDGLAHLVAGKQVELLSDEQVAMLVTRHLPREAPSLLPAAVHAAEVRAAEVAAQAAASRAAASQAAAPAASSGSSLAASAHSMITSPVAAAPLHAGAIPGTSGSPGLGAAAVELMGVGEAVWMGLTWFTTAGAAVAVIWYWPRIHEFAIKVWD